MIAISGLKTSTCALAVMSIQTLTSGAPPSRPLGRSGDEALQRIDGRRSGGALHVTLVPEREREQPPELPRPVALPGDVLIEQPPHGLGTEEALPPERRGRERLARERLEVAAEPRCRGDR